MAETNKIKETGLVLKPSRRGGVGVFANCNLKKGERLYWDRKIKKVKKVEVKKDKILFGMCDKYCIEKEDYYECPLDFQKMSVIWFLNHSNKPNLEMGKDFWSLAKNLRKGEELTIDYRKLNEPNQDYLKEYKK